VQKKPPLLAIQAQNGTTLVGRGITATPATTIPFLPLQRRRQATKKPPATDVLALDFTLTHLFSCAPLLLRSFQTSLLSTISHDANGGQKGYCECI